MRLHRRPLFMITIAYAAGVICAVEAAHRPFAGPAIVACVVLIGITAPAHIVPRGICLLAVAIFAVGFLRTGTYRLVRTDDISGYAEGKMVHLTGRIASDPEALGQRTRFMLEAHSVKTYTVVHSVSGRAMVTLYRNRYERTTVHAPSYGEVVRIHGRLRIPARPSNPGAMDYAASLERQRVFCTVSATDTEMLPYGPPEEGIGYAAARLKEALTSRTLEVLPSLHARLLLGILMGDYASLPPDVQSAFMRSGTMHLLAASGYNCGIVAGILGWLMVRLSIARSRRHWILIAAIWGFVLIAGASPSIVRAAVMLSTVLAAYLLRRVPDMVNTVLFAGLVIVVCCPLSIYEVGFQLSFSAVLAIVLVAPLIKPALDRLMFPRHPMSECPGRPSRVIQKAAMAVISALMLSVVTLLGTGMVTACYFNYVSVVSILANALTALLVIALTVAGLIVLGVSLISPVLGGVLAPFATFVAGLMLGVVTSLGGCTWSALSVRSPHWIVVAGYYAVILGVLEYAYRKISRDQAVARTDVPDTDHRTDLV